MRMRTIEISVGCFVLAGLLALTYLAVRVSGINVGASETSYQVLARFDDVSGLRPRARVSIAGVNVGRVSGISVDVEYGEAIVTLEIDGEPGNLSIDTGAQILTEGILGTRYISLLPGADEEMLGAGDTITETQGAFVLENLIGEFITRMGAS